jgi:hypothetical protein
MSGIRKFLAFDVLTTKGLLAVTVILVSWSLISFVSPGIPSPAALLRTVSTPAPETFYDKLTVGNGVLFSWRLSLSSSEAPGRLYGYWTSGGRNAGVPGALGDTLESYALLGPNNQVLGGLDNPASGNFDVQCDGPGVYTFEFNNRGLLRNTPRIVEIHATFQPDRK